MRAKSSGMPIGYGFVVPDSGEGGDLYLSAKEMRAVLHGDRVAVRVAGTDRKGRREGALVEILQRTNLQVVGRFFEEGHIGFVIPDNKRLNSGYYCAAGGQRRGPRRRLCAGGYC